MRNCSRTTCMLMPWSCPWRDWKPFQISPEPLYVQFLTMSTPHIDTARRAHPTGPAYLHRGWPNNSHRTAHRRSRHSERTLSLGTSTACTYPTRNSHQCTTMREYASRWTKVDRVSTAIGPGLTTRKSAKRRSTCSRRSSPP